LWEEIFCGCWEKFGVNKRREKAKGVRIVLRGKRVIVIGERDGVPGPAIANCVVAAGGQVVYLTTECFV